MNNGKCFCDLCEKLRKVNQVCKHVKICNVCLADINEAENFLKRGESEFVEKNYKNFKFETRGIRKLLDY